MQPLLFYCNAGILSHAAAVAASESGLLPPSTVIDVMQNGLNGWYSAGGRFKAKQVWDLPPDSSLQRRRVGIPYHASKLKALIPT